MQRESKNFLQLSKLVDLSITFTYFTLQFTFMQ
jgi:hypothetical protein